MVYFLIYFLAKETLKLRREICPKKIVEITKLAWYLLSKTCAKLIDSIKQILHSQAFIARHRNSPKHFTRKRKLPFHLLICFLADFAKGPYQNELDKFFKALNGSELPQRHVSKSALTRARAKLNASAFVELNQHLVSLFQRLFTPKTWKGFRLLAADSTTIRLPKLPVIESHFGAWRPRQGDPCPMARASLLFDVLNKVAIRASISPKAVNERTQAQELFDQLQPTDLVLLDRGYPCFWLFKIILAKGGQFCARMPKNLLSVKELVQANVKEKIVQWYLPPTSVKQCRDLGIDMQPLSIRLIRIDHLGNEPLFLATSLLDSKKYPYQWFADLYHQRWPVEEDYKTIKCRLEMENFTGETVLSIYQDFHAKLFYKNLTAVLSFPAQQRLHNQGSKDKHVHQVNFAYALSISKRATMLLFYKSKCKIIEILQQMLHLFINTTEPLRPGRKYPRNVRPKERRYFCAYKPIT
jgi:hypothetical protein